MDLFALLIGINDYPSKPLAQCVADAGKMENYLLTLSQSFGNIQIKKLINDAASRENVIDHISTFIGNAKDDDVALIYYSGHGAQQESGKSFPEEQDGLLECMVCYAPGSMSSDQLLADKELRYLLHKLKSNPHLITIFDACHSGDMTRGISIDDDAYGMIKRIAGVFKARNTNSYVFKGDHEVETRIGDVLQFQIPFKDHVHIAACLSSESSWEDSEGGVFTRYLLSLLDSTQGNLSYFDIARWAKISLKNITQKKQTPTITVQGDGGVSAHHSWLNLHPNGTAFPKGLVTNNQNEGWIYSRGTFLGIEKGMNVLISVDDENVITVKVKETALDHSKLDIPLALANKLDFNASYNAKTEVSTYSELRLYINEIDKGPDVITSLQKILSTFSNVKSVASNDADFFVNVFNGMIYFSLPEHDFQPIAEQIIINESGTFQKKFESQLKAFIKWQHFYSLDNPGKDFEKSPLEVKLIHDGKQKDVTNGTISLVPNEKRLKSGELYQSNQIEITNTSDEILYVGVLTLGSDMSITSGPFDGLVIELPAGESKMFFDHTTQKLAYITLDNYKEIYNWKEEWFYYKFIFNNFEDFTPSLQDHDFLQPALEPPLTISSARGMTRGIVIEEETEVKEKWGTCITRIELSNSTYNVFTGELKSKIDEYSKSKEIAPFIRKLYFTENNNGGNVELRLKQNKDHTADEANKIAENKLIASKFLKQ